MKHLLKTLSCIICLLLAINSKAEVTVMSFPNIGGSGCVWISEEWYSNGDGSIRIVCTDVWVMPCGFVVPAGGNFNDYAEGHARLNVETAVNAAGKTVVTRVTVQACENLNGGDGCSSINDPLSLEQVKNQLNAFLQRQQE